MVACPTASLLSSSPTRVWAHLSPAEQEEHVSPVRGGDKAARQEAIRRIIHNHAVSTQEELGALLAREGIDVTQATLSRDLAQLGAMRVSRPEGGTVYGLESAPPPP